MLFARTVEVSANTAAVIRTLVGRPSAKMQADSVRDVSPREGVGQVA